MKLTDLIKIGKETISVLYPEREAGEMVFAYLEEALGTKKHTHIVEPEYEVVSEKAETILEDFNRMAAGEPLQYVTGKAWFYGRQFHVTPDVLIPRPETEVLCNTVINRFHADRGCKVLDMCTGSGCIAWTLALEMPGAEVAAVDISDGALRVASTQDFAEEISRSGAQSPQFYKADVLEAPKELGQFDIIVSNPPYVCDSEKLQMRPNVLEHEPHLALFVPDADPLMFYRAIAQLSGRLLKPGGALMFEINERFGQETKKILQDLGFGNCRVVQDIFGKDRMVLGYKNFS